MRDRFWNNLINVRFQAFYYERYAALVAFADKGSAIFLALVSSSSVGLWLVWKEYPAVWASIIAASQAIIVIKPFLPFLKKATDYTRCSLELEKLYNSTEKIWFECERTKDPTEYEQALVQLREKKHKLDTQYSSLPLMDLPYVIRRARKDIDAFMSLNFPFNS